MLDLKKYFTDGLIQVAILLSLAGMRVDVDPYLPPLGRILEGPSSAVTQTQFHNLWNILDEYHPHPKSVDLDGFFTARRLLSWVGSLDHLQVPVVELEAWLVHREPDNGVSIPSQLGLLEDGGLEDVQDPSELSVRLGVAELGYDVGEDDTFGAVGHMSRSLTHPDQDEVIKEEGDGMSVIWEQDHHQDQLENARTQPLQLFNEEEEDFMMDGWRNTNPFQDQMFEENAQLSGVREDTSLSIEECLRLIDVNLLSREDSELPGPDPQNVEEHELQFQRPIISPSLPEQNSTFSLEQQWQDVLAIMESQDMDIAETTDDSHHNIRESTRNIASLENFIHQDVSLHQATLPRSTEGLNTNSIAMEETRCINNPSVENTSFEMSSNENCLFEDSDIVDLLLTPGINSSGSSNCPPCSLFDQQNLSFSHLEPLLEEAMLDETGLMDLAPGELNQAESDSGLSLNYSQNPSSPSGSESSSSSSSCSSSPSSPLPNSTPEEGAVGFTHIKEEEEEGAIGGFMPEETKMSHTSFLEAKQFHNVPWLEHIGHDHTYNQPRNSVQKKFSKHRFDDPLMKLEQLSSRDEKRASALNIPFPNEFIINLPVDEFSQLLSKYHLTDAQLTLIRDIRRRGKNKMAAQNCRRRKLDVVLGLERRVDGLRRHRARLLRENAEVCRSVREMKQRLNSLYQEVCERLREEQGSLCSDFGLEEDDNSPVGLVSRRSDSHSGRKRSKRRKEKK